MLSTSRSFIAATFATCVFASTSAIAETVVTRLVLNTDAACDATIDGRPVEPVLAPGEPRTITVAPGTANVECTSVSLREAIVKQTVTVAEGSTHHVAFDVAPLIVKAQCSGKAATLADLGLGVLRHCVTGVDWTQSDSGPGGFVFVAAHDYCKAKGKGWEIPMPDELAELIDRTGKSQTPCGKHTCNVSPRFKLASPIFWSNEKTHEGMHMIVNLILGGRHPTADDANYDYHTLCVRRPPSR